MSEPSSNSRKLLLHESDFVENILRHLVLPLHIEDYIFEVFEGRERMIIKTSSNFAKKKVLSFYFKDCFDNNDVFVDVLLAQQGSDMEIWLWKPLPGGEFICIPDWKEVRIDPEAYLEN